jgi:hypothetical protein
MWPIPVAARSQAWVCGRSLAGILGSNPVGGWMPVSCECCVLSGRGLCVGLTTRPEESCRLWYVLGVIMNHRERGGPGPLGLLLHVKKIMLNLVLCLSGLANFNPLEGHIIRKISPDDLTCVYMYRWRRGRGEN